MKYIFTILMGVFLVVTTGAKAEICENSSEGSGFVNVIVNNNQAPDALKMRDEYKQKLADIAKEVSLTKFKVTEESANIYSSESTVDSGLDNVKYTTTSLRISFEFEPHNKIQEFYNKLVSENIDADLMSNTTVECDD